MTAVKFDKVMFYFYNNNIIIIIFQVSSHFAGGFAAIRPEPLDLDEQHLP